MKRLSKLITALFLAVLTAAMVPAHVFADSPDYIGEIKIYIGDYKEATGEGFTILKGDDGKPVDLNQKAGGGLGSKGEKAVYLGYKTTKNKSEAVTDLALMNMKGGYRTKDYENLMNTQMKSQIIPLVDSLLDAIKEYRTNYYSENELNQKRAQYVHDVLNKFTDDDCGGAGLGDLLLNETKYEIGDKAYNALSADKKKEHADILTIFAQSNGNATLILENMITRAADTNDDLWIDRFAEITYDDLVDSTGLPPTDAEKTLAKLYDDDAREILGMWTEFREHIDNYENAVKILEDASKKDFSEDEEAVNKLDFETSTEAQTEAAARATVDIQYSAEELANASADVFCKEYLESIDYEDGTMLDFFMQNEEELKDDITVLYPLVASLTEGQRAGLEFITLQDLVMFGSTDENGYREAAANTLEPTSVYLGVDRAIYEKGGVALTSDAIRNDVVIEPTDEQSAALHIWSGIAAGLALAGAGVFIASWAVKNSADKIVNTYNATVKNLTDSIARQEATVIRMQQALTKFNQKGLTELAETQSKNIASYTKSIANAQKELKSLPYDAEFINRTQARSAFCSKLRIGAAVFTAVMVAVTAALLYYDYQQMKEYYNVEFTPQPRYIVEEKDLIGYNAKGEKIVLKNQSAYYKIVDCNRTANAEFYKLLGTGNDLNGDVGRQWLSLYAVKKDLMPPVLASSLKVVVDSANVPAGYKTGIHMFGSGAAFNLNSSLYDWADDAPEVFIYFMTEDSSANSSGSSFTPGTVAITGGAGLAVGALATALGMKSTGKKKKAGQV
jgi:hypothetical protein